MKMKHIIWPEIEHYTLDGKTFKLTPEQQTFIVSRKFDDALVGGPRTGKTLALVLSALFFLQDCRGEYDNGLLLVPNRVAFQRVVDILTQSPWWDGLARESRHCFRFVGSKRDLDIHIHPPGDSVYRYGGVIARWLGLDNIALGHHELDYMYSRASRKGVFRRTIGLYAPANSDNLVLP